MSDLVGLGAVELQALIADGQLSCVELIDATIARIEATNSRVNAIVSTCFDVARAQARDADARRRDASPGPLFGLPVVVKDLADTAGLRTTYGSRCFEHHVPTSDAIIVQRLREAGAIVLAKTNTPEFGAGANTVNKVFGATGNPFDTRLTSGGSSGGSAAALACDMAPIATGSDLGGSLRIPASFCSVVGMRPSPGVVPSSSHAAGFSPLWTDGPMARNVADTALMLSAISGFDRRDPIASAAPRIDAGNGRTHADLSRLRVGFSTDLGVALVDAPIAAVFEQRQRVIGACFGEVRDTALDLSEAAETFRVLRASSLYAAHGELVRAQPELIGDNVVAAIDDARHFSLADVARADAAHTALYARCQALFDDIDVLVCPATAVSPFPVAQSHPVEINGTPLSDYYAWYAVTWALSLAASPVISLPCGTDHNGMPFGVQLVGPRHGDTALLRVAAALEAQLADKGLSRIVP